MGSARVTANVGAQLLFNTPLHMKGKIDSINIDNQGASGQIQVNVQDIFTQDLSNAVNAPVVRTATPLTVSAPATQFTFLDKNSLPNLSILGAGSIICDKTDAACIITVQFHFE